MNRPSWALALLAACFTTAVSAAQPVETLPEPAEPSYFSYGPRGLQFESPDGNNFLWFGMRLQTRYSNEAVTQDELPNQPTSTQTDFALNRGRLKLGNPGLRRFCIEE